MPELPDITVYLDALVPRILHHRLESISIRGPFLLRSADPPISAAEGREVVALRRGGKRIAIGLEGGLWLVLHLMIAGRLHWKPTAPKPTDKRVLAAFLFDNGVLTLTEAGTQHRAALHLVAGEAALAALDAGGIDPLDSSPELFAAALRAENHTLKRALTDPPLQRHRQRLLRRDPPPRPALAGRSDSAPPRRRRRATPRRHPRSPR